MTQTSRLAQNTSYEFLLVRGVHRYAYTISITITSTFFRIRPLGAPRHRGAHAGLELACGPLWGMYLDNREVYGRNLFCSNLP